VLRASRSIARSCSTLYAQYVHLDEQPASVPAAWSGSGSGASHGWDSKKGVASDEPRSSGLIRHGRQHVQAWFKAVNSTAASVTTCTAFAIRQVQKRVAVSAPVELPRNKSCDLQPLWELTAFKPCLDMLSPMANQPCPSRLITLRPQFLESQPWEAPDPPQS